MGWDITYHPWGSDDIAKVYFAGVDTPTLVASFAEKFNVPQFHHKNLAQAFAKGSDSDMDGPFGTCHGMNMAVVAGHLRTYWYVRNAALSFLAEDEHFAGYFSDFKDLVPESHKGLQFDNRLTQNYCCGVYIDNAALTRLMGDMETNPYVREKMQAVFSNGTLAVFSAAAAYALQEGLGLLEASEIVEPNPLDLNASSSLSNLHNCDPAGPILYHETVLEQLRTMETPEEHAEHDAESVKSVPEEAEEAPKKKSFLQRLFGSK